MTSGSMFLTNQIDLYIKLNMFNGKPNNINIELNNINEKKNTVYKT